jgi:nitrogen fixation-related uncharacterized protein
VTLIAMWVFYTAFGVIFFSAVFLWAVRNRQFSSQDRARYLPLAELPESAGVAGRQWAARRVMAVPAVLGLMCAVAIAAALWCAYIR